MKPDGGELQGPQEGQEGGTGGADAGSGALVPVEPNGQHSAAQAASSDRPTIQVHPDAPLADAEAVEIHGLTWDVDGKHWRDADGRRICGAHPLRPKGLCRRREIFVANGRCKHHRGGAVSGVAHPNYKHGRWCKAWSTKRANEYEESINDPDLLDLSRTLAVFDMQVKEAIERLEALDTPRFRARAVVLFRECERILRKDPIRAAEKLNELGQLLERGSSEDVAREELRRCTRDMSKYVKEAWKIRLDASQVVNRSDLQASHDSWNEVVFDWVPKKDHGSFLEDLYRRRLSGRPTHASADPGVR